MGAMLLSLMTVFKKWRHVGKVMICHPSDCEPSLGGSPACTLLLRMVVILGACVRAASMEFLCDMLL